MTIYSYRETIDHFAQQLRAELPSGDIESDGVDLYLDNTQITLTPGQIPGELVMQTDIGYFLQELSEDQLVELQSSNFYGINTGGCTLSLDPDGVTLSIKATTSTATSPQENWQWFHRLLSIADAWKETLFHWESFVPLMQLEKGEM